MVSLEQGEVKIGASDMTLRFYLLPYLEELFRRRSDTPRPCHLIKNSIILKIHHLHRNLRRHPEKVFIFIENRHNYLGDKFLCLFLCAPRIFCRFHRLFKIIQA